MTYYSFSYSGLEISSSQIAWILLINSKIPYLYRMSDNGTILQIICFGNLTLSYNSGYAFMSVISETDFIFVLSSDLINDDMKVSPTSGKDYSIARISTDLSIK